jgi:hypothetical protein
LLLVAQGLATNYFDPSTDTSKKTTKILNYVSEIFGRRIMYDLIDCKKQSHDTTSSTEYQILDQCKTKTTENFFKCCEGYV